MNAPAALPPVVLALGLAVLAPTPSTVLSGQARVSGAKDDGPHVFWRAPDTAVVFYLCDGEPLHRVGALAGPAVIRGFCKDRDARYRISNRTPDPEPDTFQDGEKIFAVSDIHGEHDALLRLLVNAGVVDEDLRWSWGKGHLVVLGDVFDRGDQVTECLWLIHRLEEEALRAGGRVHYVLGNHELMVLQGDLRYVDRRYQEGIVEGVGVSYDDLFGPAMELGRWLRSKSAAVRVNGVLFVHGGISPEVVARKLTLEEINRETRTWIDLRSYDLVFRDLPGFLFGGRGPFWYRGYHRAMDYPKATEEDVTKVLDHFDATHLVVGHTDIGEIRSLYEGRVFGIDVDVASLGSLQGLLWQNGSFFQVKGDGSRVAPTDGYPR